MRKTSKNLVGMLILLILLILILAGVYAFGVRHFQTHFFPNTTINGIAVGDMTADDAKYAIQSRIRDYTLTVNERGGITETITGDQIYMQFADDGQVQECLDSQDPKTWLFRLTGGKVYTTKLGYIYDKASIDSVLDQMQCFQSENEIAPTSAKIIETEEGDFAIQDSQEGTMLDRQKTRLAIMQAIEENASSMDLEALDLYQKAAVDANDENMQEKVADVNQMLATDLVYDFVDRQYVVDRALVREFIRQDDDGNYKLNRDRILEWVKQMAYDTDTFGMTHEFKTTSGRTITLAAGGDYGWVINQEETANELYHAIMDGQQGKIEPIYVFRAQDRSSNDIGGTYVEICIEKQTMWCYQNYQLVVETPVVTGNHAALQDTPSGCVWAIDGKEANAIFPENGARVKYWLPFYLSCGVHDANWRKQFGGTIWLHNGSNGCVNTPEAAAGLIFQVMDVGYPVVVYYSEDQPVGTQPANAPIPG